ncbi:uncharacterized protein LY89DRAFT_690176 [Mollisia scopiformis]|uniref:Uncharacterized protein n=1 Tax=Mollisia scopiformis TaxID=149040 RepID=A0A132BD44_MOLSC|nr:uncharacterized protein LY89DRAFT_690176 [Mollisia scopiformis]KUJ09764.1 hypothetical protein LY89DRAFT_690176 [Mollisia scopiformis]
MNSSNVTTAVESCEDPQFVAKAIVLAVFLVFIQIPLVSTGFFFGYHYMALRVKMRLPDVVAIEKLLIEVEEKRWGEGTYRRDGKRPTFEIEAEV